MEEPARNPAEDVLEQMAVQKMDRVYVLGCHSHRITLYSQQCRALNLIWALFELGRLKAEMKVAVIGGGAGGLTVAVAALSQGCRVTLFEEQPNLLHMQSGSAERFVHPHLYDWPKEGSDERHARLPLLDWEAGLAGDVAKQILSGWEEIKKGYQGRVQAEMKCRVKQIEESGEKARVLTESLSYKEARFECAIVSVGFGRERGFGGIEPRTYWKNDGIHQPGPSNQNGGTRKKYLVTGNGDGGLIDVLRLRFPNFDHRELASSFDGDEFKSIRKELMEIEAKAIAESRAGRNSFDFQAEYNQLVTSEDWIEKFQRSLRQDTEVVLHGKEEYPFHLRASVLNRLGVYLLLRHDQEMTSYKSGDIRVSRATFGSKHKVIFKNDEEEYFHEIVVRHGIDPEIDRLPNLEPRLTQKPPWLQEKEDTTLKPHWGNFYSDLRRPVPDLTSEGPFPPGEGTTSGLNRRSDSPPVPAPKPELPRRVLWFFTQVRWHLPRTLDLTMAFFVVALFLPYVQVVLQGHGLGGESNYINIWDRTYIIKVTIVGILFFIFRFFEPFIPKPGPDQVLAFSRLISEFQGCPLDPHRVNRIRQDSLDCVAQSTAELLKCPTSSLLVRLATFTDHNKTAIRVVAESPRDENPDYDPYPASFRDELPPLPHWLAIEKSKDYVEHGAHKDPNKAYRSVLCVPIRDNHKRVYGAVSIESNEPFVFWNRKDMNKVKRHIKPCITAIRLTFNANKDPFV